MSDYDFPEEEPKENTEFKPLEIGFYLMQIKEVGKSLASSGGKLYTVKMLFKGQIVKDGMINCTEKEVYYYITFPTKEEGESDPGKTEIRWSYIRKFLKTIEEPYKGKVDIIHENWVGKLLAVKIKHEKYNNYVNEKVGYVLTAGDAFKTFKNDEETTVKLVTNALIFVETGEIKEIEKNETKEEFEDEEFADRLGNELEMENGDVPF
jgi:hypothetical protein